MTNEEGSVQLADAEWTLRGACKVLGFSVNSPTGRVGAGNLPKIPFCRKTIRGRLWSHRACLLITAGHLLGQRKPAKISMRNDTKAPTIARYYPPTTVARPLGLLQMHPDQRRHRVSSARTPAQRWPPTPAEASAGDPARRVLRCPLGAATNQQLVDTQQAPHRSQRLVLCGLAP
jgi:hypothetical protein